MERFPKQSANRHSAYSKRTAQGKFPAHSAQGDIASRIDDSPLMTAQNQKLQSLFGGAAQRRGAEDEVSQGQFAAQAPAQREEESAPRPNNTGLPDNLKSGIENLSGLSMDHVKVHYNSSLPAQLNALAYAQGGDIHVAPGQEKHLPHEAWHVVQQAQGRVQPTMQMKDGGAVNDDKGLEREADVMGGRAVQRHDALPETGYVPVAIQACSTSVVQARGVTLEIVKQAIGTSFRVTGGDSQVSSDDIICGNGIKCHFSVRVGNPGNIHVSYYPANDAEYKSKILHYGYTWNVENETFGNPSQLLATWKPYKNMFYFFQGDAQRRMDELAVRIRQLLDEPLSESNVTSNDPMNESSSDDESYRYFSTDENKKRFPRYGNYESSRDLFY